jgi:hypothetical protein
LGQTPKDFIAIGSNLRDVKDCVSDHDFQSWLRAALHLDFGTAQSLMSVAARFGNDRVSELPIARAVGEAVSLQEIIDNRGPLRGELHQRLAIVRDLVRSVALGYSTGLYLFGRPGTAKTHTVKAVLDGEIKEIYTYERGHLTPMGLFELIAGHVDEVIVLDDLAAILKSDIALQILLAALEPPTTRDRSRVIKYRRQGRQQTAIFRGGIICISNKELHDDDLLEAFKSRVNTLNYDPSDAQLGALMLAIADAGWPPGAVSPEINPEAARTVAHYVIAEMLRLSCPFDLRLLVDKAFAHYQLCQDDESESDWHNLVTAAIEERLVVVRHPAEPPESREARKRKEHTILDKILQEHESREDRIGAWIKLTGKSPRAFYRRMAERR